MRRDFRDKLLRSIERLRSKVLCPVNESMFIHRTQGDIDYLDELYDRLAERLNASHGGCVSIRRIWFGIALSCALSFVSCLKTGRIGTCYVETNESALEKGEPHRNSVWQLLASVRSSYVVFLPFYGVLELA